MTVNPNGSFTYTPTTGFTGLDSFTYTASDGVNTGAPATAYVLVGNPAVGVQVNDGSIQRSEVRSLTVAFNGTASFLYQSQFDERFHYYPFHWQARWMQSPFAGR